MKKIITITLLFATSFLLAFHSAPLESAINFLNSLNQNQRTKAQLPFDDVSKSTWHYIPGSMWPRKGVSLADLDGNQKKLLHNLIIMFKTYGELNFLNFGECYILLKEIKLK